MGKKYRKKRLQSQAMVTHQPKGPPTRNPTIGDFEDAMAELAEWRSGKRKPALSAEPTYTRADLERVAWAMLEEIERDAHHESERDSVHAMVDAAVAKTLAAAGGE